MPPDPDGASEDQRRQQVDSTDSHIEERLAARSQMSTRRKLSLATFLLVIATLAFGAWLGLSARDAKTNLERARVSAVDAKDALLKGDAADATKAATAASNYAQMAHDDSHTLPWDIAAAVPWLGSPFAAGQEITEVVLDLSSNVLKPAAVAGNALVPEKLMAAGRVDVEALRAEQPALADLASNATRVADNAQEITESSVFHALSEARAALQRQTADVAAVLRNASLAADIVPSMMGVDGPRSYFMGFQTNAEARGTGGLLGGFGILRLDNGVVDVDTLAPNTELDKPFAPIDLGAEYNESYGYNDPTTDFRNSNFSAHFPYAARVWQSMWTQQTGTVVDGAIAIDPVALSYVLGAVGPVTLADGEAVTQENVVELTESTAYVRFPDDQPARKRYLQDIAQKVVEKVTGPVASSRELFDALGRAVGEGRIAVWSSLPAEQETLELTPLAHIIPTDAAPYSQVVINNLGGNKLEYYLRREIEYTADGCRGATRNSTVKVRLTSAVPPGLPEYVAGSSGVVTAAPVTIPPGTMVTSVRIVATNGATLRSALSNEQRVPVFRSTERGHPTFEIQVAIPAGKSGELTFNLTEPTSHGAARVDVQPLVDHPSLQFAVPTCAG